MSGTARSHVALAVGLAVGLAAASGCSGTDIEDDDGVDDGSRRGELIIYQADDFDTGTSRTTYALRDALGGEQPLQFDSDPKLAPGTPVKVWGSATGDTLRVTSFRRMPPRDTTIQSALIGAAPFAPRSFAFVLVDTGGGFAQVRWDGTKHDVTTDFLMGRLINDDDSLRNYYLGDSYQMQDITAKVVGPLSATRRTAATPARWPRALRPMVDAQGGPFQHYLWYYGTRNSSCSWSGLASVGTPQSPHAKHLVQPVRRLRRADPGARPQLRHAALVVARLRHVGGDGRLRTAATSANTAIRSTRWAAAAGT